MSGGDASVGRRRVAIDAMDPWSAAALHLALDRPGPPPGPGDPLPPFEHHLHFREASAGAELGRDGHPAIGGFIPDLGLKRRMWAGGRLRFHRPVPLGAPARRITTIAALRETRGRSGKLAFVTLRHEITPLADAPEDGPALIEEQDLVYRPDPAPGDPPAPPPDEAPRDEARARRRTCGPTLLFRYSALTYNGHRIHYDAAYAREIEGHRGIVVHGPLLATLMLDLWREHGGAPPAAFEFRATAPICAGEPFETCLAETGDGARLWVRTAAGALAMTGALTRAA